MEYLEGGSLAELIKEFGPLDEPTIAYVLKELLSVRHTIALMISGACCRCFCAIGKMFCDSAAWALAGRRWRICTASGRYIETSRRGIFLSLAMEP